MNLKNKKKSGGAKKKKPVQPVPRVEVRAPGCFIAPGCADSRHFRIEWKSTKSLKRKIKLMRDRVTRTWNRRPPGRRRPRLLQRLQLQYHLRLRLTRTSPRHLLQDITQCWQSFGIHSTCECPVRAYSFAVPTTNGSLIATAASMKQDQRSIVSYSLR